MKVCITGANGFVGKSLAKLLEKHKISLLLASRSIESESFGQNLKLDFNNMENLHLSLTGCDVVVHLAARVHMMKNSLQHSSQEYLKINTQLTEKLIHQAILAGVKRFIFVSTVKVFGESSPVNQPFLEKDTCKPQDDYSVSKLKAEEILLETAKKSAIEVVIIRPPLIYGQGVKANFASLLKLIHHRVPLPFGAINNKRSLIYVENLTHFIMYCLSHPAAKNEVFSISDGSDVSTTSLIQEISRAINAPIWNVKFPERWLIFISRIFRKDKQIMRLCGNLQVDISKAKILLGWTPPFTLQQGLKQTVENFVR